jgi:hypothetical protein
MFANRIQAFTAIPNDTQTGFQPAFVACPFALFAAFNPAHQSLIAEVYRRAQELTQAQVQKPRRKRVVEFSVN